MIVRSKEILGVFHGHQGMAFADQRVIKVYNTVTRQNKVRGSYDAKTQS